MTGSGFDYKTILGMSYHFFSKCTCTPETLNQYVEKMMRLLIESGVSRETFYSDLERLHSVTLLDSASFLDDHSDHVEWFNPSLNTGISRDIDWHFWDHFRDYLTAAKNWPGAVVRNLDKLSSEILSRLEDPRREGEWDRRGMVIGSVQSGKTANYMGLTAKALDAGYKLIVVMAGVHNSLRSQTQFRLNEEILGYDLDRVQEYSGQAARIGVRAMFPDHGIVQTLTSSNERGDFKKNIVEQAGLFPTRDGNPTIMVVKKHVSILGHLIDWATSIIGVEDNRGMKIVTDVPLLVIDDECDYASVNTKKVVKDENGVILEECNPAKTNQRIRELLNSFHKSSYVGYTATPFANIFIHHEDRHPRFGEDLFPRNFIISLPRPTNYLGPERVFGLLDNPAAGIEQQEPLPLLVVVEDSEGIIPGKHRKDLAINHLPESLKEAIRSFLLSCAARRLRRSSPVHSSMLVHVTRFTNVQAQVHEFIEKELRRYIGRIRNKNDELDDFRSLWNESFKRSSRIMKNEFNCPVHTWEEVLDNLYPVASKVQVKTVNGSSKESLQYRDAEMETKRRENTGEEVPWEERGVHVIAIGGDKLSRGLTLDGLTVSYYLRASRMYDTLMQMGRWFGYRDGYPDLCRIYTASELMEWYSFIATASQELQQELEYMGLIGEEPRNFGLKVLSHPGQLAITSAGKRRNAEKIDLSYSWRLSQTVVFDLSQTGTNLRALEDLVGASRREGTQWSKLSSPHWSGVSPQTVIRFLNTYRTHEEAALVVDPKKMATFIEEQLRHGDEDLTTWDVAIISRGRQDKILDIGDLSIGCSERTPNAPVVDESMAIGALHDPQYEWIDFGEDEQENLRQRWRDLEMSKGRGAPDPGKRPPGYLIRDARPKQRGLLLIYPIYCEKTDRKYGTDKGHEVIGIAVSWPGSDTTHQVTYEVNSVHKDAED